MKLTEDEALELAWRKAYNMLDEKYNNGTLIKADSVKALQLAEKTYGQIRDGGINDLEINLLINLPSTPTWINEHADKPIEIGREDEIK